jgi:hypothetical protein
LDEVPVKGERPLHATLPHNDKRKTVGQGERLVGVLPPKISLKGSGFALLLCCASFILGPSSTMRFDIETQDLTTGRAQRTALPERVAEATTPRFGRRMFMSEVITRNSRMPV